jgi:hypothetical protein
MKRKMIFCTCVAAIGLATASQPVQAGSKGGALAAGIIGGLAAGAIIGSAVAQPRPAYVVEPAYAPSCYYTQGRRVWDDSRGAWVRPRVRVCD